MPTRSSRTHRAPQRIAEAGLGRRAPGRPRTSRPPARRPCVAFRARDERWPTMSSSAGGRSAPWPTTSPVPDQRDLVMPFSRSTTSGCHRPAEHSSTSGPSAAVACRVAQGRRRAVRAVRVSHTSAMQRSPSMSRLTHLDTGSALERGDERPAVGPDLDNHCWPPRHVSSISARKASMTRDWAPVRGSPPRCRASLGREHAHLGAQRDHRHLSLGSMPRAALALIRSASAPPSGWPRLGSAGPLDGVLADPRCLAARVASSASKLARNRAASSRASSRLSRPPSIRSARSSSSR
jgi:hypothetical protein